MRPLRVATVVVPALAALCVLAPTAGAAGLSAHGSIGQAYVLGARGGEQLRLTDRSGRVVARGRADRLGSRIFREVDPGAGYVVRRASGRPTPRFRVLSERSNPPASFFRREKLKAGLNYVTMRDGVELAMTVRLPAGRTLADGPFPTLIEHSGYQIAAPNDLLQSVINALSGGSGTADPLAPAAGTAVGSLIAPLLGFAVVSVQMRGSGCSGGAFDLFDLPTTYDGYDMVETVAAQSWVKGDKVGLAGISFSGITPAVRRGHAAAAPRRHRPDVGDRRPLLRDRVPRRHPQLRLRLVLDRGAHGRRPARPGGRPAVRAGARARG